MFSEIKLPALVSTSLVERRADQLYRKHLQRVHERTDRMFAALLILQWVASIATALWLSPRAWAGSISSVHIHVWTALGFGGLVTILPIMLAAWLPGRTVTRHVIAVAQVMTSALLIHLAGGRIETHFHVFGSLAFLAFYRDWHVLITASAVVALDHLLRGIYWPQSVFGVLSASWLRSLEHTGWVVFEDIFLIRACLLSTREMRKIAQRTAELEATNALIEQRVVERSEQLRVSDERARNILSTSIDAFVAINDQGAIVEWNTQAEKLFGWSAAEALGKPITETIIPERNVGGHLAGFRRFLVNGEGPLLGKPIEVMARRRDETEVSVELTISAMQINGSWLFSAFVRDITKRKQVEAELQRAKEAAEAANRAKSDFLANMSHEIRTPMNGIIGMTELALDTGLSAVQREYLQTISGCADALLTVIDDILDFSKIEAGKLRLDEAEFDLAELLGHTCKALGLRADQKQLELACDLHADVPHDLIGDAGRLRQIIINLVGNALKFTETGEVVVSVHLDSRRGQTVAIHFCVSDTGIGISPEKQAIVFRAFEQADTSTTRLYGGTGLGLAITSRLVQLMNGRIWVESIPDVGSNFHFTVPFGVAASSKPTRPRSLAAKLENMRVLVVDDNATNRRILDELLTSWNMRPTTVADGPTALEVLATASRTGEPYSLIVLDAQMPRMDGFAVAEAIQRQQLAVGAVVMMLTSLGQLADSQHCLELGMAACLTKPIKQSELYDAIVNALGATDGPPDAVVEPVVLTSAVGESPRRAKILLAEDNLVNQRVAIGILRNHHYDVTAVDNGLAALQALKATAFDLVLMDVQMPEMDGFAATAAIRNLERLSGSHLPIIAMTARALTGDCEACLAAGMDAYLSKPLHSRQLLAAIETALSAAAQPAVLPASACINPQPVQPTSLAVSIAADNLPETPAIDFDSLLERVEHDASLAAEMIELYLQSAPQWLAEIEASVERRDPADIQKAAHALLGALQNLSAEPGASAASQLEADGRFGELDGVDRDLNILRRELHRLQHELTNWSEEVCI